MICVGSNDTPLPMNSGAAAREVPAEENVDMDTKDEKPVGNAAQVSDETSVKAPVEQEQPNVKVPFMLLDMKRTFWFNLAQECVPFHCGAE